MNVTVKAVDEIQTPEAAAPRGIDPLLLLGSIILLAAILTWVLPAGRFDRVTVAATGRTMVVPGSYKFVPQHPVGPWGVLLAIPQGLVEAAEVIFYVLLAGGALCVIEATGAIGSFLNHLLWRYGSRPLLILSATSVLFVIGGASYNMYEEIIAFIPLLCILVRRLGLREEMALGLSLGTASVAACFSPVNTFTLGISQPMAQLPLFSGLAFRSVMFVLAMAIWAGYLAWYATRYRDLTAAAAGPDSMTHPPSPWKARDIAVLTVLNCGMLSVVLGGVFLQWGLREFSAIFVLMAAAGGWVGGLGWRGTSEHLCEGFRRMALAAILVGFARAISVVLANGLILDTIANALFSPLRHFSLGVSAVLMMVSESALAFPMSSDSGRAVMSLPVLIPLADLLGLSRQMVVCAYQYSSLVASLITPTAGALLAMVAMARISFTRWLRFLAVPFAALFLLAALAMVVGVRLGIQ